MKFEKQLLSTICKCCLILLALGYPCRAGNLWKEQKGSTLTVVRRDAIPGSRIDPIKIEVEKTLKKRDQVEDSFHDFSRRIRRSVVGQPTSEKVSSVGLGQV